MCYYFQLCSLAVNTARGTGCRSQNTEADKQLLLKWVNLMLWQPYIDLVRTNEISSGQFEIVLVRTTADKKKCRHDEKKVVLK